MNVTLVIMATVGAILFKLIGCLCLILIDPELKKDDEKPFAVLGYFCVLVWGIMAFLIGRAVG